jgi:hypothetical protein
MVASSTNFMAAASQSKVKAKKYQRGTKHKSPGRPGLQVTRQLSVRSV